MKRKRYTKNLYRVRLKCNKGREDERERERQRKGYTKNVYRVRLKCNEGREDERERERDTENVYRV